jgi:hypothetical protein
MPLHTRLKTRWIAHKRINAPAPARAHPWRQHGSAHPAKTHARKGILRTLRLPGLANQRNLKLSTFATTPFVEGFLYGILEKDRA